MRSADDLSPAHFLTYLAFLLLTAYCLLLNAYCLLI